MLEKHWIIDGIRGLGGEVEETAEEKAVTVLLEPDAASSIGLPEYCRLSFDANDGREGSVSLNQELIEKVASVFSAKGAVARGSFDPGPEFPWPGPKKVESFCKIKNAKIVFKEEVRVRDQTYAVWYAGYSAVSDEKRDAVVSAAVNIASGTVAAGLGAAIELCLEENRITPGLSEPPSIPAAVRDTLGRVMRWETSLHLIDFTQSLSKRLTRDCDRIYDYYSRLLEDTVAVSTKKNVSLNDISERTTFIKKEYSKKIDDLRVKYRMNVSINPMALLLVTMPCACASFTVHMGAINREVQIPWNPLTARPDATTCARCGSPAENIRLCRGFHWLCEGCWKRCEACGKEFCPICKPKGCVHS